MKIGAVLRSMDFRQLWSLFKLCITNLRYVYPTFRATRRTITICDELYGKKHHKNGRANAFRHALWNALIVQRCKASGRPVEKGVQWAKLFTDWHEDFSPNKPLARAMDLHNNQVGRDLIGEFPDESEDFIVGQLLKMVPLSQKRACEVHNHRESFAVKRNILQEMQETDQLIHIEDD